MGRPRRMAQSMKGDRAYRAFSWFVLITVPAIWLSLLGYALSVRTDTGWYIWWALVALFLVVTIERDVWRELHKYEDGAECRS